MNFKYRGVAGSCHYNHEMKMFVGELMKTDYLVTFKGGSVNEAKQEFIKVTNKYLDNKNKTSKE